jgi:ABC-2 type transport system ATP-binding protein
MSAESVIEAQSLTRHFGERIAIDHIDFGISRGEVFGFLGPNGAGKSTTVRMLTGYIPPTNGTARIAGCDIVAEPVAARQHIGVVPEEASAYADLTVWQNIMLMGELHSVSRSRRSERGGELIDLFGLADRRDQKGRDLSKGLRQRLMLCMALVSDPEILFLDEPTSGLDVASSHVIREMVTWMNRERGMTVFIPTHNIDEAGDLCHRVGIIDRGRLVAIDTPLALRGSIDARRSVEIRFSDRAIAISDLIPDTNAEIMTLVDGFRIYTAEPGRLAQELATRATTRGIQIASLNTLTPSLEEVFLHITARAVAPAVERAPADAG